MLPSINAEINTIAKLLENSKTDRTIIRAIDDYLGKEENNINDTNEGKLTMVMLATLTGRINIVKYLIDKGALLGDGTGEQLWWMSKLGHNNTQEEMQRIEHEIHSNNNSIAILNELEEFYMLGDPEAIIQYQEEHGIDTTADMDDLIEEIANEQRILQNDIDEYITHLQILDEQLKEFNETSDYLKKHMAKLEKLQEKDAKNWTKTASLIDVENSNIMQKLPPEMVYEVMNNLSRNDYKNKELIIKYNNSTRKRKPTDDGSKNPTKKKKGGKTKTSKTKKSKRNGGHQRSRREPCTVHNIEDRLAEVNNILIRSEDYTTHQDQEVALDRITNLIAPNEFGAGFVRMNAEGLVTNQAFMSLLVERYMRRGGKPINSKRKGKRKMKNKSKKN